MAQHSGFFNALEVGGVYDRKYNADDYSNNMAAIISTGVRRSGDDDLRVTGSGLTVTVAPGRAWIDGRWFYNDTALAISTVTPPVGSLTRADGVYLHLDANQQTRSITLIYKTGTPSSNPTPPACVRENNVFEIQLATVTVAPNASSVSIADTRGNQSVCGWITTPVGYNDYFTSLDNEFTTWFENIRNTVASVTLFKQYTWGTTIQSQTSTVQFDIPQYTADGIDILDVFTNGLLETAGTDYTVSGSTITFSAPKIAGTKIFVRVYKSIDGTGLGSVSDEITALQNQVAELGDINELYYFCNGINDNVKLSEIVQNFLNGSTSDDKKMKIYVVGTFGINGAAAGSGTTVSRYRWFNFEAASTTNRQVTIDFYNCSPVSIQPPEDSYNTIFYGGNYSLEGLTLTAGGSDYSTLHLQGVDGAAINTPVSFTDCNISMNGSWTGGAFLFSEYGTFTNCKIIVINTLNSASVFGLMSDAALVQVFGGRYYAYTGSSQGFGAAVYSASGLSSAAITVQGANFPSAARTSLNQTNAVLFNSGYISAFGIISPLTISTTSNATANIYGTIPLDKD